jgi:hypothetical protein
MLRFYHAGMSFSGTMYFDVMIIPGQRYEEDEMRSIGSLLALWLLLSSPVFAEEEKSTVKEGIKEINRGATEVGHAVEKAVNKGAEEVDKTAKKIFKKTGKDKKDEQDSKNAPKD